MQNEPLPAQPDKADPPSSVENSLVPLGYLERLPPTVLEPDDPPLIDQISVPGSVYPGFPQHVPSSTAYSPQMVYPHFMNPFPTPGAFQSYMNMNFPNGFPNNGWIPAQNFSQVPQNFAVPKAVPPNFHNVSHATLHPRLQKPQKLNESKEPQKHLPTISDKPAESDPNHENSNDDEGSFIDITAYLRLPQKTAAEKLNIPTSTLSKRWTDAVKKRKWPYRALSKLDKEITTLLMNIPKNNGQPGTEENLPPEIQQKLGKLLLEREEHLKPVFIRLKQPPAELSRNEHEGEDL